MKRLTVSQRFALKDAAGALMDYAQNIEAAHTYAGRWAADEAGEQAKVDYRWLLAVIDRLNNFSRKQARK